MTDRSLAGQRVGLSCSEIEWRCRVELAAAYRIFDMLGWTELIYNHISLRIPDGSDTFLINPFGLMYHEVTASNLVKVDSRGHVIGTSSYRVNPAGFLIHGAIHRSVPNAHCVMHTHTTAGSAVACLRDGLSFDNFYAAQLHERVAYHDFEGITIHEDEAPRLLKSLGDKRLLILRSHGLLSHGETLAQAFSLMWTLNRACELQIASHSTGKMTIPIDRSALEASARDALQFDPAYGAGQDVFDALVRKVRRIDPTFEE